MTAQDKAIQMQMQQVPRREVPSVRHIHLGFTMSARFTACIRMI